MKKRRLKAAFGGSIVSLVASAIIYVWCYGIKAPLYSGNVAPLAFLILSVIAFIFMYFVNVVYDQTQEEIEEKEMP